MGGRHSSSQVFSSLALLLPLLLHPLGAVPLFYLTVSLVQGLALSVVFQLRIAWRRPLSPCPGRTPAGWRRAGPYTRSKRPSISRRSRLLSWFIGGLDFQIEHHLFPRLCHVNYPALAPLVEETCREFGLRYAAHETFRAGIASHFRWLRRMGKPSLP